MNHLPQLSFDFTFPETVSNVADGRSRHSWQVRRLAARHRLPIRQAAFYADVLGIPVREVPHA